MRTKVRVYKGVLIALLFTFIPVSAISAQKVTAGSTCKVLKQKSVYQNKTYTCVKSGKKLAWNKGVVVVKPTPTPTPTAIGDPVGAVGGTPSQIPAATQTASLDRMAYEAVKLEAYTNIRLEAEKGNLSNVNLVYHISPFFPKDLEALYKKQVEYTSKLYGSFFTKNEIINIYLYTEKDEEYLRTEKLFSSEYENYQRWFSDWKNGINQEHNLGLAAWYMEYPLPGILQGHAGLIVYSGATLFSLRQYAIQVMPHEYFHVVQDYYIQAGRNSKFTDAASYQLMFPPVFREGSANTISFALATESKVEYLSLYKNFVDQQKTSSLATLIKGLKSESDVVNTLYKIETKIGSDEAHEASYSIGALLFEWVIAEYGFDAYRKIIINQLVGNSFEDNIKVSLGISKDELYKKAAKHILAAFTVQ